VPGLAKKLVAAIHPADDPDRAIDRIELAAGMASATMIALFGQLISSAG
jgi:hypothetical protein